MQVAVAIRNPFLRLTGFVCQHIKVSSPLLPYDKFSRIGILLQQNSGHLADPTDFSIENGMLEFERAGGNVCLTVSKNTASWFMLVSFSEFFFLSAFLNKELM
jgi:hypothetical protein